MKTSSPLELEEVINSVLLELEELDVFNSVLLELEELDVFSSVLLELEDEDVIISVLLELDDELELDELEVINSVLLDDDELLGELLDDELLQNSWMPVKSKPVISPSVPVTDILPSPTSVQASMEKS